MFLTYFSVPLILLTLLTSGAIAGSKAEALPLWSEYRLMKMSSRQPIDQAIGKILRRIEAAPYNHGKIRFCVSGQEHWETSPTASCESTRKTSVRHAWPTVLTSATDSYAWISLARLLTAFCESSIDVETCKTLKIENSPMKKEALKNSSSEFSFLRKLAQASLAVFLPMAHADASEPPLIDVPSAPLETCKVRDGVMTSKTGTKIHFDFGPHSDPKHAALLTEIAARSARTKSESSFFGSSSSSDAKSDSASDPAVNDQAIKDGLEVLSSMGKALSGNMKSKGPEYLSLIVKDGAQWIGIEMTEAEAGDRTGAKILADYRQLTEQLRSQFKARKPLRKEAENIQEAMTIVKCPGVATCVWLQNEAARKKTSLLPLESEVLKKRRLELEQDAKSHFDRFEAMVVEKKLLPEELIMIRREYSNLLLTTEVPTPQVRNRLRGAYAVPEVSKTMVALVDIVIEMKKNSIAQDRAIAETALAQSGTGIVSLSNSRRDHILAAFEDVCEGPKPVPVKNAAATKRAPVTSKTAPTAIVPAAPAATTVK